MLPKFRAWDKKTKEYFHISELWNSGTAPECFHFDGWTDNFGGKGRLKDIVIEQSTGLKDVNGKEIYVGDIIQATIEDCVQDDKYLVKNMWDPHVWVEESDSYYAVSKMEVKGNVHTNPELLEAQHG